MDQDGNHNAEVLGCLPTTIDVFERDCTSRCRSQTQASFLLAAMIRGNTNQVQSYCRYTCSNFGTLVDGFGRTLLHIASSCGKTDLVTWLLKNCQATVDTKDKESGWTALHRSLFYGQLAAARILLSNKASLKIVDHDGLTPLGIVMKDRLPYVEYRTSDPSEVYAWGSNSNFNLGTGNDLSKEIPESLEHFRRLNVSISKVVIRKFHTAFLSNDGQLFTCGHGLGGRLGQTCEATLITPEKVKGLGQYRTVSIAAGQHHLVILTDGGQVWSCGTNTYHQLGHVPPPEFLLVPRPMSLKLLKGHKIIGCAAAKFHSVIFTNDAIFTFGLNAGQLGHPKGDRTQILPRQVAALNNKDTKITLVEASDGATICATDKGDVYVLHEYQCRKIASRQLELKKICVVGGRLDTRCDVAGIKEDGAHELIVLLLTHSGKLFVWREERPILIRCLFAQTHQLILAYVCLNYYCLGFITNEGAGFTGRFIQHTQDKKAEEKTPVKNRSISGQSNLVPFLNRDECEILRVKRIPFLHRANTIFCDSKGRNYAAIQSHPKTHLTEVPLVSASTMENDLKKLYDQTCLEDSVHDVVIKVGKFTYPAHKFILASRSEYFQKQLVKNGSENPNEKVHLNMDFAKPEIFELILRYLYYNNCDYLVEGKLLPNLSKSTSNLKDAKIAETKKKKKASSAPIRSTEHMNVIHSILDLAKKLGLKALTERLNRVTVVNNRVVTKSDLSLPSMSFDLKRFPDFYDIRLQTDDGVEFNCNKCVLMARMEYFYGMLSCGWIESSSTSSISLPISSKVMTVLLEYLYNDLGTRLYESEDIDFICQSLTVSDQYLIPRLKEMSEVALIDTITLKNVCELLQFSYVFNSEQLKKTCLQYICINISALLEMGNLDLLRDETMSDLTTTYRNMVGGMDNRVITPYSFGPDTEELEIVAKLYPVKPDQEFHPGEKEERPKRRRTQSRRFSEKDVDETREVEKEIKIENDPFTPGIIEKSKEVSPVTETTMTISVKPKTPFKFSGGWSTPVSPKEASDVPSLSQIMQAESCDIESQKPSVVAKKVVGLSQKQRKALAKNPDLPLDTPKPSPTLLDWVSNKTPSPIVRENPWNISKETVFTPTFSLNDEIPAMEQIIQEELEEELIRQDAETKSLALIRIEEQAMQELLAHYEAQYYPDEIIRVCRIVPVKTVAPHWRKN